MDCCSVMTFTIKVEGENEKSYSTGSSKKRVQTNLEFDETPIL